MKVNGTFYKEQISHTWPAPTVSHPRPVKTLVATLEILITTHITHAWLKIVSQHGSHAGWHKLCNPASRALRMFSNLWGFLRIFVVLKGVLSPQSSIFNPQSSVLSPQKCPNKCFSQKLHLQHFSRKCRENLNIRTLRINFRLWGFPPTCACLRPCKNKRRGKDVFNYQYQMVWPLSFTVTTRYWGKFIKI